MFAGLGACDGLNLFTINLIVYVAYSSGYSNHGLINHFIHNNQIFGVEQLCLNYLAELIHQAKFLLVMW